MPGDNGEQEKSNKRKWKEGKVGNSKVYSHLDALLKKIVENQESLHRKLLETLDRRNQEGIAREDAWNRQEAVRSNKDQELRARQHALATNREAALVAFLQKATDQTLQLPPTAPPQTMTVVVPEAHHADNHQEKESFDPNSKMWRKPEVQALIRLRSQMETRFQEAGPKGPLWEEICTGMACLGYSQNAKRCKKKWENINIYFRKTKETNKKRPDNANTCPYVHQLDILYRKGALGTPNSKLNKLDSNSDELLDHPSNREDSGGHGNDADDMVALILLELQQERASGATHVFSSPDNGSSGDRSSKKGMTSR